MLKATIALWRKEKNAGKSTYENSVTTKGIIPFAIA
ncbi:unnamed protein product, partial [marine sediment metagenome]